MPGDGGRCGLGGKWIVVYDGGNTVVACSSMFLMILEFV